MVQVSERLSNDHAAVDKVLKQLQTALRSSDVEVAHTKLDLFWARLAVHIRAEHLHLFPTVLSSFEDRAISDAPTLDEAQTVVAQLREDHDFFMHELARAVEIMRQLVNSSEPTVLSEGLADVKNTLLQVEQRLVKHNEVEEAVAITTLAGARLIIAAPESVMLNDLMPFLKGFTLFFWAAGTWWIPLLLILGFWRHVYKRFPLKYDPQYWGMVFPLGMYTVCTIQLARAINFSPLLVIPRYFIYLALAGWLAVSLGLIYSLLSRKSGTTV